MSIGIISPDDLDYLLNSRNRLKVKRLPLVPVKQTRIGDVDMREEAGARDVVRDVTGGLPQATGSDFLEERKRLGGKADQYQNEIEGCEDQEVHS